VSGTLPVWFEVASLVVITGVLVADLVIIGRRPHVPGFAESARWVGFYVALALVFAGLVYLVGGAQPATEFVAGWLTEYSLSLDNLFVFALILTAFAVPRELQQRTLMIGILIALGLRAVLIVAGAAVVDRFTWVFFIFGVILLVTAYGMLKGQDEEEEYKENATVRAVRRVMPVSEHYDGKSLTTRIDVEVPADPALDPAPGQVSPFGTPASVADAPIARDVAPYDVTSSEATTGQPASGQPAAYETRRALTPMALVILALGTTDLLFALDSIPAIFGITSNPFIVFTTNLFALMGLRQLYFMLSGLMERLTYLKFGLAAILAFIGVKLVLHALHTNSLPFLNGGEPIEWGPEISTGASLVVIVACLGLAALASLVARRSPSGPPAPLR